MSTEYNKADHKREMAKAITIIWKSNIGECPYTPEQLEAMEWKRMPLEMPAIYYSELGDDAFKDLPQIPSAGVRIKKSSEAYNILEVMVDIGIVHEVDVKFRKGEAPMALCTMDFPDRADLDGLDEEQYRIMMGTVMIGWIKAYMIDAYRRDTGRIFNETMTFLMGRYKDLAKDVENFAPPTKDAIH